jgi:hypothetical protein
MIGSHHSGYFGFLPMIQYRGLRERYVEFSDVLRGAEMVSEIEHE